MSKLGEIRSLFDAKLRESGKELDPRDLTRVKNDKYLYRVLEHSNNDVLQAVDMLWGIMVWRKDNNINEMSEETINLDYVKAGIFFPRGRDIDSCLVFIMKLKLYVKGQRDSAALKKVIIYWLERIEREEDGKKISVLFDADGCGLNNMDLDIIMYLVTVFNNYYPLMVNYIIIFQLPWILSAGFKIVKGILPAKAVDRLRMVNKEKLKDIIVPEQALTCWGGKDDYKFEFIPEKKESSKRVTFAVNQRDGSKKMLKISPLNIITFKLVNDEISSKFTVTNADDGTVSYKIRTTSPEKYKVRPSSGTLQTGSSESISITLLPGFDIQSVIKDRFLIVAIQIPKEDMTPREVNELWKSSAEKMEEYRLKCGRSEESKKEIAPVDQSVDIVGNLKHNYEDLSKKVDVLKFYQLLNLFLIVVIIFLGLLVYKNASSNC